MNKYSQEPEHIFDLHGKTRFEAEAILGEILRDRNFNHVRIITGKGTWREGGGVLKDFVKLYLSDRGIRFNQSKVREGGEGAIEVYLH